MNSCGLCIQCSEGGREGLGGRCVTRAGAGEREDGKYPLLVCNTTSGNGPVGRPPGRQIVPCRRFE